MSTALPSSIIDSHQHFWTAENQHHGADYTATEYLSDAALTVDHLRATVFAECNTHYDATLPPALQSVGETRFAAEIGQRFADQPVRLAAAVIGHADPFAEGVAFGDILDQHLAAAAGRLSAVRRSVAWDEDASLNYPILRTSPNMLGDARFAQALKALAERGLAFETWLYHPQIGELTELAGRAPDCTIVLDHAGTPLAAGRYEAADGVFAAWKEAMARLSGAANVHVKLALATPGTTVDALRRTRGLERWTAPALAEAIGPYLDHLIRYFGCERCLFESNFPIDKAHADYAVLAEAYSDALAAHDEAGRAAVFAGNAARVYRIPA